MRTVLITGVVLLVIVTSHLQHKQTHHPSNEKINESQKVSEVLKHSPPPPSQRSPAQANPRPVIAPVKKQEPLQKDLSSQIIFHEKVEGLPQNLRWVSNVRMVSAVDYQSHMGEKLEKKKGFVFFKVEGNPHDDWSNVVFDEKENTFYPVSSVLNITNVNEDLRQELLNQGIQEHYYHKGLKILYVENDHGQVLENYRELINQGLQVELEIIRGFHIKK